MLIDFSLAVGNRTSGDGCVSWNDASSHGGILA